MTKALLAYQDLDLDQRFAFSSGNKLSSWGFAGPSLRDAATPQVVACVAADATEPLVGVTCQACILAQLFACLDAKGCTEETTALACCAADCAGDDACTSRECNGELQAFGLCAFYLAPECLDFTSGYLGACFAKE